MSDAWSTVVTRESEWNKYAQDRALALVMYEARRCPNCNNWDALVPVESKSKRVPLADGSERQVEVASLRCIFCGVADLVKRDDAKKNEGIEPSPGQALWSDGLIYAARPPIEEVN